MSNLVKQYNVVQQQEKVRVIDYNGIIEQKLAAIIKEQNGGEAVEGFRSLDSITEELELVDVKEPEEILQEAEEQAEQIVSEAKGQAEVIINSAKQEAENVLQQAKDEGYQAGYGEGSQQAREELEVEFRQKKSELDSFKQELQENYNREMRQLEPKLLDVILEVVQKVFHIQFDDKKEILLHLIENAIKNIEGSKNFHIRVGEEQQAFVEKHKEDIMDRVGHDISLEVLSDQSLNSNQCVIETDSGVFDCSLGVQLENLIKDLRSLSS